MNPYPTKPTLRVFLAIVVRSSPRSVPAVSTSYSDQCSKNIPPCVRRGHRRVREHAAIPTDMLIGASLDAIFTTHPQTGCLDDIHPAVRILYGAVTPGLVMRTGAMHRAIVLRDMKIDRPRTQSIRHLRESLHQHILL